MNDTKKRPRRWFRRVAVTIGALLGIFIVLSVISARLYQGPRTLDAVAAAMPEAPIFPFAELTANNAAQQRAMAIPLWLLRRQGAARAETAFFVVPADPAFIHEWYTGELTKAGWTPTTDTPTRLLFIKNQAAIQLIIGLQRDLLTPYQLVYLDGLTERQLANLNK